MLPEYHWQAKLLPTATTPTGRIAIPTMPDGYGLTLCSTMDFTPHEVSAQGDHVRENARRVQLTPGRCRRLS
jgi:hypothetical protein